MIEKNIIKTTIDLPSLLGRLSYQSRTIVLKPWNECKLRDIHQSLERGMPSVDFDPIYLCYNKSKKEFMIIDGHHRVSAFNSREIENINCTISFE